MTFNPPTLVALGKYITSNGFINLGVVGDTNHLEKGTSYHLGKDDLISTAYSIRTARDKAGLSNAASAIDLGKLDGSLDKLYAFSRKFAQECFDGNPLYNDIREIIFWSVTRQRVIGWSDLAPGQWINDYGDISHKTHTHISWYRDSEFRSKIPVFSKFFPTSASGVDVPTLSSYIPGQIASIKPTANIRVEPKLTAAILRVISVTEKWAPPGAVTGWVKGDIDPDGGSDQWLTRWFNGKWEYTAKSNVSAGPSLPVVQPIDCAPAIALAVAPLNAQIGVLEGQVTTAKQDEWDRINGAATVKVQMPPRP